MESLHGHMQAKQHFSRKRTNLVRGRRYQEEYGEDDFMIEKIKDHVLVVIYTFFVVCVCSTTI